MKRYAGWAFIAAFVAGYDLAAPETLSNVFRHHRKNPLVIALWVSLSAHLFGLIPRKYDPYSKLHRMERKLL